MRSWSLVKWLAVLALGIGALLLVPLAAMQLTHEINWGWGDFVLAGSLMFGAGTAIVLACRSFERPLPRGFAVFAILAALALVWAELAVGLFH